MAATKTSLATLAGCLLLAGAACFAAAAEDAASHVKVLGTADFDDSVNDGSVYFIKVSCSWGWLWFIWC